MAQNKNSIVKNVTNALPGVILILLMAGVLTFGGKVVVAEATKPKPKVVKTVTVESKTDAEVKAEADAAASAKAASEAAASSAAASASASVPVAQPAANTAKTNSFVYLRPTASTSGTALEGLQAGTEVTYETKSGSNDLWQKVTVNGKLGYVYKKWLTY